MARDRAATKLGVIHCSATSPGMNVTVEQIHRWHVQRGIISDRGRTGYHFLIDREGQLFAGRELNEMGAHAYGHNDESVSVCLFGGIDDDGRPQNNFTGPQWLTLEVIVSFWLALWPELVICGHNDLTDRKACPSFDVMNWLDETYQEEAMVRLHDYRKEHPKT